jgi:hypothetical protein
MRVTRRFLSPALFLAGLIAGSAISLPAAAQMMGPGNQPRMQSALRHLQAAYDDLQAARPDKGGFRVKAMNDIQDAMANVRHGVRWANNH